MFSKTERIIALRNLRPKKKEGFLKVISIFSFIGIMLGVSILIIVMSVMNGFRIDLTNKILGFNPHIVIQPYSKKIDDKLKEILIKKYENISVRDAFSGEGIVITNNITKGIYIKGTNDFSFLNDLIIDGNLNSFEKNSIIIGKELAINLGVVAGDRINVMSPNFIGTPLGGIPKQEIFTINSIFSSGFFEFDQNVVLLNLDDSLSFFEKQKDSLSLEIFLDDPINADVYKEEIQNIDEGNYVYSWTDINKSFFNALKVERNVMFIILTLIIIVAAFNIISGLTILIKNKTKEIAIFQTLGLTNKSIVKAFFLTGFIIGLVASIFGVILGTIFSIYIEDIRYFISSIFKIEIFPPDVYYLDKMPSEINFISITTIFFFSIIITALASYLPARLIVKMKTLHALKYE